MQKSLALIIFKYAPRARCTKFSSLMVFIIIIGNSISAKLKCDIWNENRYVILLIKLVAKQLLSNLKMFKKLEVIKLSKYR